MNFFLLLTGLCFAVFAEARELPSTVVDDAQIFPPGRRKELEAKILDLGNRRGLGLVVHTLETLDGEPIEAYSARFLRQWQDGNNPQAQKLLLTLAIGDRKMWLEGSDLPDKAQETLVRILKPRLFEGRTVDGIIEFIDVLDKEYEAKGERKRAEKTPLPVPPTGTLLWALGVGLLLLGWRYLRRRSSSSLPPPL